MDDLTPFQWGLKQVNVAAARGLLDSGSSGVTVAVLDSGIQIDHPDLATRDVSSLRSIRYGAAPIDQTLLRAAMGAFPSAGFLQVYGQTEAAPVVTALAPEFHTTDPDVPHMASAGRSIPTAEIAILGADDSECPRGEVGEICVRGPTVMIGYWNRPEETALRPGATRAGTSF